jgi:hypothetical protein
MVDRHDLAVHFDQILQNHLSHRLSLRCENARDSAASIRP